MGALHYSSYWINDHLLTNDVSKIFWAFLPEIHALSICIGSNSLQTLLFLLNFVLFVIVF
jgi:hypothetical protein